MQRPILIGIFLAAFSAAAAQSLDAPSAPDRSPARAGSTPEATFESKGIIELKRAALVDCSEGAATGENLESALQFCDAAVSADPANGDARYYRGFVLYHLERFAEAEAAFTEAIDLGADRLAESHFQRGVCREAQRRLREAAADFKAASELKPAWSAARRKVDEYQWAYK